MHNRNRFLNEYESYRIIRRLLELNSPVEPGPQLLDAVTVGVDPLRALYLLLIGAAGNGRSGTEIPNVLSKAMAAVTPIGDDPCWHGIEMIQQPGRHRQFVRLPWGQSKTNRPAKAVGDHAGFGAEPAT